MKNTMKRLLCLLLALVMCAGLALGAAAEDGEDDDTPTGGGDGNDTPVYATGITLDKSTLEMSVGGAEETLTPTVTPDKYVMGITWVSSNTDVATVSGGKVTAVSAGTAVITAKVTGSDRDHTATCIVTVTETPVETPVETSVKSIVIKPDGPGNMEVNRELKLTAYAVYEDGSDKEDKEINVEWSSDNEKVATVSNGGVVKAVGTGNAIITAKNSELGKEATFSISVTPSETPTPVLVISGGSIAGGSGKYTLSMSNGSTTQLYAEVQPKNTSTESDKITWEVTKNSNVVSVDNGKIKALSNGTATVTVKCGTLAATITVTVTGSRTKDITIKLSDDSAYTFSSAATVGKISAASAISSAINEVSEKSYSSISFGTPSSASKKVGTLYANSDKKSLLYFDSYTASTSGEHPVSKLCFVPEWEGTYTVSYTAYDDSGNELCSGNLIIVVPGEGNGEMDISFNATAGDSVYLAEDVFESWYRQQKGSSYNLAYVTFDGASRSFGSFKHSGSSFTPGNDVRYYSDGYTGSTGSNPGYLLDNVKYTAPNSTGYLSVDFTCYGGTSTSASGTAASGTFFIFVTNGSVKGITHDVNYGSAVTLSESDFSTVYKNAMSASSSSTRFYIELLDIPSKGTLYYNYTSDSKPGTKLTGSNFDDYKFYVNSSSSYDSVADLTYVPANSSSGTVSVRYLARSTGGDPMYVGTVSFSYGAQLSASVSCGADGYTFKLSDFYYSGDADPVAYVTFTQPDSGKLMLGYANGRGILLSRSVELYTIKPANGSYPLTSLSYIPKAGFSGSVDVNYTAVTESGNAQSGVLTINVTSRKDSAHFKDVLATGSGAWASNAIDYAYKWGLVNGTSEDTFSPDSTMTRAMLVTILYRSAGSPKVSGSCPFTDVAAGTYYYDAVIWAAGSGIVTGTSETTFSPDRDVNREQVAAFLHRYAKYNGESVAVTGTLNGYSDKSYVSQYAIEPMSWAVQHGYITSTSSDELLLSPGDSATRAQVAVMLHRFLTY